MHRNDPHANQSTLHNDAAFDLKLCLTEVARAANRTIAGEP